MCNGERSFTLYIYMDRDLVRLVEGRKTQTGNGKSGDTISAFKRETVQALYNRKKSEYREAKSIPVE